MKFEKAISIPKKAFVQEKIDIFANHERAIRIQQAGETLDQYLQTLHPL